jgi:hypothetical protein
MGETENSTPIGESPNEVQYDRLGRERIPEDKICYGKEELESITNSLSVKGDVSWWTQTSNEYIKQKYGEELAKMAPIAEELVLRNKGKRYTKDLYNQLEICGADALKASEAYPPNLEPPFKTHEEIDAAFERLRLFIEESGQL